MSLFNTFIYWTHLSLGRSQLFNQLVQKLYLSILVPALSYYLKKKFLNLKELIIRNSLTEKSFTALLSDIDVYLIIEDGSNSKDLINTFLRLRKFFIMLDSPEIYTESEYRQLFDLKTKSEWQLINFCWNIRKINWCHKKLVQNKDRLTVYKMNRSIKASFRKIMNKPYSINQSIFHLNDFKYLDQIVPNESDSGSILCYTSPYTAMTNHPFVILEMSPVQFQMFNSLMPGEQVSKGFPSTPAFQELKRSLTLHELLLSRSAIRLKEAAETDCSEHRGWCSTLEQYLR